MFNGFCSPDTLPRHSWKAHDTPHMVSHFCWGGFAEIICFVYPFTDRCPRQEDLHQILFSSDKDCHFGKYSIRYGYLPSIWNGVGLQSARIEPLLISLLLFCSPYSKQCNPISSNRKQPLYRYTGILLATNGQQDEVRYKENSHTHVTT